jgi:hypothetical protein
VSDCFRQASSTQSTCGKGNIRIIRTDSFGMERRARSGAPSFLILFLSVNMIAQGRVACRASAFQFSQRSSRQCIRYSGRRFSTASPSDHGHDVAPDVNETAINKSTDNKALVEKVPKRRQNQRKKFHAPPLPDASDFPDWSYEERDFFKFELIHQSSKSMARVGRIHTPHGIIDTPGFVAVATNAALKVRIGAGRDIVKSVHTFCKSYLIVFVSFFS